MAQRAVRQVQLEKALLLKQYNVSRLTERIEAAGLIARRPCPEDARAKRIVLTHDGRAMRDRMWMIYGPRLDSLVGDALGEADSATLSALLTRLRNHVRTSD